MTTRKSFLASASIFTLSPAIAGAQATGSSAPPGAPKDPYAFDQARFAGMLAQPAKHKQCFGAKKLEGGGVLDGMQNTINAYVDYLHEPVANTHAVAVLYHGASIALALNDAVWNDLVSPFLPHAPKIIGEDFSQITVGKGNPFLHSTSESRDDVSVERLVGQGSSFFVCHNAIAGFAHLLAAQLKRPFGQIYGELLSGIVPGALVVPAGVMAVNACQEAGFTYISAS